MSNGIERCTDDVGCQAGQCCACLENQRRLRGEVRSLETLLQQFRAGTDGQSHIWKLIQRERARQDAKWGEQNHDPEHWLTILTEEVGEVAKAILENDGREYAREMVQVAAVVVGALECAMRNTTRGTYAPEPGDDPLEAVMGSITHVRRCDCKGLDEPEDERHGEVPGA